MPALEYTSPSISVKSLTNRISRAERFAGMVKATEPARMLGRVRRESMGLERLYDELRDAVTDFKEGVTVGDDRRIELLLQVCKGLDQQRERLLDLMGAPKRPAQNGKDRKPVSQLTLATPAITHEIEPSGPSSESSPTL